MNRVVTPPADGAECGFAGQTQSPRRSRAVARALVVQRRSLVWPVTASARPGSFLAWVGTCRAGPAAPLAVPATARRLLPLPLRVSRSRRPLRYAPGRARVGGVKSTYCDWHTRPKRPRTIRHNGDAIVLADNDQALIR